MVTTGDTELEYTISEQVRAWADAHGFDVELHLDHFQDYLANKPGKPYKDLDAAYRSCVRADWGGLRRNQKGKQNGFTNERDEARKRVARELCGYESESIDGFSSRVN